MLMVESQPFSRQHLADLCTFTSIRAMSQWPAPSVLMTSDIAWQLPGADPKANLRLWYSADQLIGFAWFQPPCMLIFDVDETFADDVAPDILHWGIERRETFPEATIPYLDATNMEEWAAALGNAENIQRDAGKVLVTSAFDSDDNMIDTLNEFGFEATRHTNPHMKHDLDVGEPEPSGINVRAIESDEIDDYAAAHRDAWGPNSTFNRERLEAVMGVGDIFEPDLCLVAELQGEIAGTTIFWADPISHIGNIEPFGVRPAYRGQGVSGALIQGGLRKLKNKGMQHCRVYTAGFNHQAQRLYHACGFEDVGICRSFKRTC